MPTMTHEEVKASFARRGMTVTKWARSRDVPATLVYQVLAGKKRGTRGKCHDIAVMLGLKEGIVSSGADPRLIELDWRQPEVDVIPG